MRATPGRRMPDAGSTERIEGSRRHAARRQRDGQGARPPRFINRLPNRLPPAKQAQAAALRPSRPGSKTAPGGTPRPSRPAPVASLGAPRLSPREQRPLLEEGGRNAALAPSIQPEKGPRMRNPCVSSLENVTLEEALSYIDAANGDELGAARTLAKDRNLLDGSKSDPDETEVHHALFLLRRARGLDAPSFDLMRVQLRRRVAA
jgi:hypothetical protein